MQSHDLLLAGGASASPQSDTAVGQFQRRAAHGVDVDHDGGNEEGEQGDADFKMSFGGGPLDIENSI